MWKQRQISKLKIINIKTGGSKNKNEDGFKRMSVLILVAISKLKYPLSKNKE